MSAQEVLLLAHQPKRKGATQVTIFLIQTQDRSDHSWHTRQTTHDKRIAWKLRDIIARDYGLETRINITEE